MRFGSHLWTFVVFLLGWTCCAFGHGARCTVIGGAVSVEAAYDDGSAMAFCDAEVFRPGSEDEEAYQAGTTDPLGRFAFVPDTIGTWLVTVDDAMGHRATVEVVVDSSGVGAGGGAGVSRIHGGIVGVSIVASIVTFGVVIRMFPHLPLFRRLILASPQPDAAAAVAVPTASAGSETASLVGAEGVTVTTLRPVGKAEIGGEVLVVRADGEYLEKGARVKIITVEGNQIHVSRC